MAFAPENQLRTSGSPPTRELSLRLASAQRPAQVSVGSLDGRSRGDPRALSCAVRPAGRRSTACAGAGDERWALTAPLWVFSRVCCIDCAHFPEGGEVLKQPPPSCQLGAGEDGEGTAGRPHPAPAGPSPDGNGPGPPPLSCGYQEPTRESASSFSGSPFPRKTEWGVKVLHESAP